MASASGGSFTPSSWSPSYDSILNDPHGSEERHYVTVRGSVNPPSPLLDPLQIPWYHPHLTRNLAEAELKEAEEGVYLMRPRYDQSSRSLKGFAIEVRDTHSVKHFQVNLNPGGLWSFGQETFDSIPSFLEHFDNRPLLGDEAGRLIVLKYPYPREVEENPDYHSSVTTHFLANPPKEQKVPPRRRRRTQSESDLSSSSGSYSSSSVDNSTKETATIHSLSLASKAGYLTKMGARVKSWKKRWFVLKDRYLSYYAKDTETQPLRVIDLSEVTSVAYCDENLERSNMFKVILPWRTFYLQAQSSELRRDWVDLLTWRMGEIQKLPETHKAKILQH